MCIALLGLLLLPVGVILFMFSLKRKFFAKVGLILILLSLPAYFVMWEFIVWQFDSARKWNMHLSVELPMYNISLVQEPGFDFYDSFFEIERTDGRKATILVDGDDYKWKKPNIIRKDGRIYFVRGEGYIDDRTPYIDPKNWVIFSGYYQRTYNIDDLDFVEPQHFSVDRVPKPFKD